MVLLQLWWFLEDSRPCNDLFSFLIQNVKKQILFFFSPNKCNFISLCNSECNKYFFLCWKPINYHLIDLVCSCRQRSHFHSNVAKWFIQHISSFFLLTVYSIFPLKLIIALILPFSEIIVWRILCRNVLLFWFYPKCYLSGIDLWREKKSIFHFGVIAKTRWRRIDVGFTA